MAPGMVLGLVFLITLPGVGIPWLPIVESKCDIVEGYAAAGKRSWQMFVDDLRRMILRDASSLRDELMGYADDGQIWTIPPGTKNSAGTLVLHLAGNIQHFIGAELGRTGYVRDRDAEFSRRNVSRADLLAEVDRAVAATRAGLAALKEEDLEQPFPGELAGHSWPTGLLLFHMATHLAYHLGQIDYHRRIVTGQTGNVTALSLAALKQGS
jgi:hypothetical protein